MELDFEKRHAIVFDFSGLRAKSLDYAFVFDKDYEKLIQDKSIEKTGYVDNWL